MASASGKPLDALLTVIVALYDSALDERLRPDVLRSPAGRLEPGGDQKDGPSNVGFTGAEKLTELGADFFRGVLMNTARITWISFAALFVVTPCANAQQANPTFSFMQTLKPVSRSYPGVEADILGIRTGMTVAQAEAIAEKSYPGKPEQHKTPDVFSYRGVTVQSQAFLQTVTFDKETAHTSDQLSMTFGSPVTGNTLYAMTRDIKFSKNGGNDPKSAEIDPSINALRAALIKKYGPPSYMSAPDSGGTNTSIDWEFTAERTRVNCRFFCQQLGSGTPTDLTGMDRDTSGLEAGCGGSIDSPNIFGIAVTIAQSPFDSSKAFEMNVSITDVQACMNDGKGAVAQLKADAVKAYKMALAKAPAAPKL